MANTHNGNGNPGQLSPRVVYDLLSTANLESTTTLSQSSALAQEHHSGPRRRLIAVAMNLEPQMLSVGEGRTHKHTFYDDVLFGIRSRADAGSADILLLTGLSFQAAGERSHYLDICRRHGAEGIVLVSFLPDEPELDDFVTSDFPCVAIDTQIFGARASFICSDNVGGAAAAVRHLVALRRKRIAYIGAWGPEPANVDRRLGYESALSEAGLALRDEYIGHAGWLHTKARERVLQMLELPEPPDAVFCASDEMAIGAMAAIEGAGLRIPQDVAVVGFDDSDYAPMAVPSLTSIRQNLVGLGTAAVEALLRTLDSPEDAPPTSVLPTELIVRESTAVTGVASTAVTNVVSTPVTSVASATAALTTPVSANAENESEIVSRLSVSGMYQLLSEASYTLPVGPQAAPDAQAQEWRPDKRRLVALALDSAPDQSFRHAFFDEMLYGLRARAYARGVDLLLITHVGTVPGEPMPPFLELCERYKVDGLIIGSLALEEPTVRELVDSHYPMAVLDIDLLSDSIAFVMSDNVKGAALLTRHLVESGCKKIAFIGGRGDERPSVDRRFGYQSELAHNNLPAPDEYIAYANWLPNLAFEATKRFLSLPEPPDAVFCASDVMAIGAMTAIEAAGLRVPQDVAVVGFDDIEYARLVAPGLTTVHQSQDALAEGLITAIINLLEHPSDAPQVSVIPVEMVVRESSTPSNAS